MLAWSQTRFFFTLAVAALLVMEPVSWIMAPIQGGCLVNPENYAAYYPGENHCPTFHVFLVAIAARAWDQFGDPNWVIADFTAVLAFSTICLWAVTWRASIRQSRDMEASIAVARRSTEIAERALTELEAPFLSIKITETGVPRKTDAVGHDFTYIEFCITNHGRTPARIIELVDKFDLFEDGKEWPREVHPDFATRSTMPYGVIAPPNGESQPFSNNVWYFMSGALVSDPLPLKTKNLFFLGFVRYSTVFGEIFRMGFCYKFDRFSHRWILFGDDRYKYNYCIKEGDVPKQSAGS
jgi:hypothetical protein